MHRLSILEAIIVILIQAGLRLISLVIGVLSAILGQRSCSRGHVLLIILLIRLLPIIHIIVVLHVYVVVYVVGVGVVGSCTRVLIVLGVLLDDHFVVALATLAAVGMALL